MPEVPPLAVTPTVWTPDGFFVGPSPWLTTRDDDVSYVRSRGVTGSGQFRADFPDIGANVPLAFVIRTKGVVIQGAAFFNMWMPPDTSVTAGYAWDPTPGWSEKALNFFDGTPLNSPPGGGPFSVYAGMQAFGFDQLHYVTYLALRLPATIDGQVVPGRRSFEP